jgi:toxin ParE1/3/4
VTIEFTPRARQQFLSAIRYIRSDKPVAAARFKRTAEKALSRLVDYPESGHPVPEYPESGYRQVIVRPYRFFYKVSGETIWIVGVWRGAQLAGM